MLRVRAQANGHRARCALDMRHAAKWGQGRSGGFTACEVINPAPTILLRPRVVFIIHRSIARRPMVCSQTAAAFPSGGAVPAHLNRDLHLSLFSTSACQYEHQALEVCAPRPRPVHAEGRSRFRRSGALRTGALLRPKFQNKRSLISLVIWQTVRQ
jgi:hypothetical protein